MLGRRHYIRRQRPHKRVARHRPALPAAVRRARPGGAVGVNVVRREASVHSVRWQASVRRVHPVHGMGQTLRIPAVPVGPERQLQRMESDLHRQQRGGKLKICIVFELPFNV